jgi:uncharacterized protein (TIGR03083 family)
MSLLAGNTRDDIVGQLDEVYSSLADLGRTLDDEQWRAMTPCPGWDVAAQYAHVIGTESMLLGRPNPEVEAPAEKPAHVRNDIGGFNEVWVDHLAPKSRDEVLGVFDEVTDARRSALAAMTEADFDAESWTPVGRADYRRFMQIRVFDQWVHEQDVRSAVGRPGHLSGAAVEQSLDEIVRSLGYVVGKKAGVPKGCSVRFELTGEAPRRIDVDVIERATVVDALAEAPTVTLTLSGWLFAALACGRTSYAEHQEQAEIAGDENLGRQVLEHMAFTI